MKVVGGGETVVGSFEVTQHHQGAPGLAHGGVISAAVDEAMGFLIWLLAAPAVTAHLEVDFRKPVPVGSILELVGHIDRVEGRKVFAVMTGRVGETVHVESRALFVKVGVEHFLPHAASSGDSWEYPYNP
jgi:acyl-coenzyme A thioesterase PaaI-like protein